jgi:lambda repressor-like predicted transcriptional regulator
MNDFLGKLKEELLSLNEAAKEREVSQDYLRFLIFKKKLKGEKIGRNWVTTHVWIEEYANTSEGLKDEKIKLGEDDVGQGAVKFV